MRKLTCPLVLFLEISPLLAFGLLAVLHPVGDPQESGSLLVRLLDYQGTYWMRNALPVPPPLLVLGAGVAIYAWFRQRSTCALVGMIVGCVLLVLWGLVMLVPLLLHVN
jgi:hypothetical protein